MRKEVDNIQNVISLLVWLLCCVDRYRTLRVSRRVRLNRRRSETTAKEFFVVLDIYAHDEVFIYLFKRCAPYLDEDP